MNEQLKLQQLKIIILNVRSRHYENVFDVYFDYSVWPMSFPQMWRSRIYELYDSQTPGGEQDNLAVLLRSSHVLSMFMSEVKSTKQINIVTQSHAAGEAKKSPTCHLRSAYNLSHSSGFSVPQPKHCN